MKHGDIDHTGITGVGVAAFVGAKVYNSANIALNTAADTLITFDSEEYDSDAFHSIVTNTGRLTIPSGLDGKYRIQAQARLTATPGVGYGFIQKNAGTILSIAPTGHLSPIASVIVTAEDDLVATDYLTFQVYAQSASKNALFIASSSPMFMLQRIG